MPSVHFAARSGSLTRVVSQPFGYSVGIHDAVMHGILRLQIAICCRRVTHLATLVSDRMVMRNGDLLGFCFAFVPNSTKCEPFDTILPRFNQHMNGLCSGLLLNGTYIIVHGSLFSISFRAIRCDVVLTSGRDRLYCHIHKLRTIRGERNFENCTRPQLPSSIAATPTIQIRIVWSRCIAAHPEMRPWHI